MDGIRQTDHFEKSTLSFPGKWIIEKLEGNAFQVDNNLKENLNRKVTSYITSIQVPTISGITGGHVYPGETHRTQHQLNQVPEHVAVPRVSSSFSAVSQEVLEHVTVPYTTGTSSATVERQETLEHVLVPDSLDTISGSAVVEHDKVCEVNDSKTELRLLETIWKVHSRFYQADAGEVQEDYSVNLQAIKDELPQAADANLCILSPKIKSPSQHPVSQPNSDDVVIKYLCDQCMMSYPSLLLLTDHLSSHSRTQLYKCLICEKGFEEIHSLHQHIYVFPWSPTCHVYQKVTHKE